MIETVGRINADAFEGQLWDIIDSRIARLAPIYMPMVAGEYPRAALKYWAGQVYVENRPFTRVLGGILAGCDDVGAQTLLADDLFEETGRGDPARNHLAIIGRFAIACGLRQEELDNIEPSRPTRDIVAYYLSLRDVPWVEALAAVGIGLEGSFLARPGLEGNVTSATMAAASLKKCYGLTDDDVEFFRLHDVTDVEHTRRALEIVSDHVHDDHDRQRVLDRVEEMAHQMTRWAAAVMEEALASV